MGVPIRITNRLRRAQTKWLLNHNECIFHHENVPVKYLFIPRKRSNTLIVVFSGMNPKRATYSYINQLNHVPHNRLYILDDFGDEILGCYYLGINGDTQVEFAINALLEKIRTEHSISKMIFCGSSKGGYAALNFGLSVADADIIVGAPQYRLGYYLTHRKSPQLLHVIAGETPDPRYIDALSRRLFDRLSDSADRFQGMVYLHYSKAEHTYDEHIQFLLQDLERFHYRYETDCCDYELHDQVGEYFPPYLIKTLSDIVG